MTACYTAERGRIYRINCSCQATRHSSPTLSVLPITNFTSAQLLAPFFFPSLVCQLVSQSYCPLGCFLSHDIYHYCIWCELGLRETEQKQPKKGVKLIKKQTNHKSLIEKDTRFTLYLATVSKGTRTTVCPCWTEVADMIETAMCFKISSIIQYMSHLRNFYIGSDSACMSTGSLPSLGWAHIGLSFSSSGRWVWKLST